MGIEPNARYKEAVRAASLARHQGPIVPIGEGSLGVVYDLGDSVVKHTLGNKKYIETQAGNQYIAGLLGISPKVHASEVVPSFIPQHERTGKPVPGGSIVMEKISDNYISPYDYVRNSPQKAQKLEMDRYKSLAILALNGVALGDRHLGNEVVHALTGRPLEFDFSDTRVLKNNQSKALAMADNLYWAFKAAGIPEAGEILGGIVRELVDDHKHDEALDIAKQGLSRLVKLKEPAIPDPNYYVPTDRFTDSTYTQT